MLFDKNYYHKDTIIPMFFIFLYDSSSLWIIKKNLIIQYGYYMYVLWKGFFVLYHTQLDSKAEWTKEKEFLQILDSFSSPTFTSLPRFAGTRIIYFVISNHFYPLPANNTDPNKLCNQCFEVPYVYLIAINIISFIS